jgi:hypothetical protein
MPQSAPPSRRAVAPSPAHQPAAVMPVQSIKDDGLSDGNVVPVRAPGSISELPDPS